MGRAPVRIVAAVIGLAWLVGCTAASPSASAPVGSQPLPEEVRCQAVNLLTPKGERIDLTGTWRGHDRGTYFIRQSGSCVWWVGLSNDTGGLQGPTPDWTRAFFGTLSSTFQLRGSYADVPWGSGFGYGPLEWLLYIDEVDGVEAVTLSITLDSGALRNDYMVRAEDEVELRVHPIDSTDCPRVVAEDGTEYIFNPSAVGWDFALPGILISPDGEQFRSTDTILVRGDVARGAGYCAAALMLFADEIVAPAP
jgi:hypothetical protein